MCHQKLRKLKMKKTNVNKQNVVVEDDNDKDVMMDITAVMQKRTNITDKDVDRLMEIFSKFNCTTVWSKVKRDDFTVRRFELGHVADTSCCELTPDAVKRFELMAKPDDDNDEDDCTGIVVKFKNKNLNKMQGEAKDDDSWIDVNTIYVALGQIGITAKVLYLDSECSVQEYIPSRLYSYKDDQDPQTVRQLAQILARIHCLRLPLSKNCSTLWKVYEDIEKSLRNDTKNSSKNRYLDLLMKQDTQKRRDKYYETLAQIDLKEPILFAMNLCRKVDSPVMMTQGDFNCTNRLVREVIRNNNKNGDNTGMVVKKEIFIIDLDNAGYIYRGIDFGSYYSTYQHSDNLFGIGEFPSDEEIKLFLHEYRTECMQQWGNDRFERDPRNSLQHMILEAKTFTLAAYAISVAFCLMMYKPESEKAEYFLTSAINASKGFQLLKKRFTDDGSIEKILKECSTE